jgi:hypothetical protein
MTHSANPPRKRPVQRGRTSRPVPLDPTEWHPGTGTFYETHSAVAVSGRTYLLDGLGLPFRRRGLASCAVRARCGPPVPWRFAFGDVGRVRVELETGAWRLCAVRERQGRHPAGAAPADRTFRVEVHVSRQVISGISEVGVRRATAPMPAASRRRSPGGGCGV